NMSRYYLYRLASWLIRYVPGAIGYSIFGWIGDLIYICAPKTRGLVIGNLRRMLGAQTDERCLHMYARQAFRNLLWNYYEMFYMPHYRLDELQARITVEGSQHVETACADGKGAVLIFPHTGNLEVLMQVPLLYPHLRFMVLVEHMKDARLLRLMRDLR